MELEFEVEIGLGAEFVDEDRWFAMGAKSDQVKGHAKEVAGIVTGDKRLKSEGKVDRLAGETKGKVDEVKDKVEEVIDKAKGTRHRK